MVNSLKFLKSVWVDKDKSNLYIFWHNNINSDETFCIDDALNANVNVLTDSFPKFKPIQLVFKVICNEIRLIELKKEQIDYEIIKDLQEIVTEYLNSSWGRYLPENDVNLLKKRIQKLYFKLPSNLIPLVLNVPKIPQVIEAEKDNLSIGLKPSLLITKEAPDSPLKEVSDTDSVDSNPERTEAVIKELFGSKLSLNAPIIKKPETNNSNILDIDYTLLATVEGMLQTAKRYTTILEMDKETLTRVTFAAFNYVGKTQGAMAITKFITWGGRFSYIQEILIVLASFVAFLAMIAFIGITMRFA